VSPSLSERGQVARPRWGARSDALAAVDEGASLPSVRADITHTSCVAAVRPREKQRPHVRCQRTRDGRLLVTDDSEACKVRSGA
jgi:hypothetical protein